MTDVKENKTVTEQEKKTEPVNAGPDSLLISEEDLAKLHEMGQKGFQLLVDSICEGNVEMAAKAVYRTPQVLLADEYAGFNPKNKQKMFRDFATNYPKFLKNERLKAAKDAVVTASKGLFYTACFAFSAAGWVKDHLDTQELVERQKMEQRVEPQKPFNISPFAPLTLITAYGLVFALREFKETKNSIEYFSSVKHIEVPDEAKRDIIQNFAKQQKQNS